MRVASRNCRQRAKGPWPAVTFRDRDDINSKAALRYRAFNLPHFLSNIGTPVCLLRCVNRPELQEDAMRQKNPAEMDRPELIGMVAALQQQLAEFTSPEHTRLYTLGRLEAIARGDDAPMPTPLWKRLFPRMK